MSRPFVALARALLLALLCLGAFSLPALASTLSVPSQYATIQAAINASVSGDTVLISDGTYTGPGNVDLDFGGRSITVASVSGDPSRTIIDCQGSASANHRGFILHNFEANAVISGLTVENGNESGNSGGAMLLVSAGVTIQNCVIKNNTAGATGGIYEVNNGGQTITLTHCTISGNTSTSSVGGGFRNFCLGSGGTTTLTDCTLSNNTAVYGGGVCNSGSSGSTLTMTNCTVSGNTATASDGGIDEVNAGTVALTNCTVMGNTAPTGGGIGTRGGAITLTNDIIYGDMGGEITGTGIVATYCDVQGGYSGMNNINADPLFISPATGDVHLRPYSPCIGAGIASGAPATDKDGTARFNPPSIGAYELGSTLTVPDRYPTIQAAINASVSGNTVLISDGTYTGPGNVDLDFGGKNLTVTSINGPASTIINCGGNLSAYHRGFYFHSGESSAVISGLTIQKGYVYYNYSQGGAVDVEGSTVALNNCIVTGNTVGSDGGGIYNHGTLTLTNCTVTGNYADSTGGGIYNDGVLTLTNSAVTSNNSYSSGGGGGIYNGGTLTLTNSTVANNSVNSGFGGGVYNVGTATLFDCAVTGNRTNNYSGAGVASSRGSMTLTNCALTGNSGGSGVYNSGSSAGTLTNCTLTGNSGYHGGVENSGTLTLTSDILYGDTSYQSGGEIYGGGVTATACDVQGGYSGTGNLNANPLFGPTGLRLQPGSPCLGAGMAAGAPVTDLDGRTRPNPPSIGAYEMANTFYVPSQYTTIQLAINASFSGDTVLIADGTYTGPGDVDLDFGGRNITVTSQNGPTSTIINCGYPTAGDHRGFTLHSGETSAVISGLTIENGYESNDSGGGIYGSNVGVTVQNCIMKSDKAVNGGGIYTDGNSTITLTNCVLTDNYAFGYGGGIYNDETGTLTVTNCTLTDNVASDGGGIYNAYDSGTLTTTDCTFTGNAAYGEVVGRDFYDGNGGGIYTGGNGTSTLTVTNCTFTVNTADAAGAAICNYSNNTILLINDILYGDTPSQAGEISGGAVTATYCDVGGGYAGTGNINADPKFVNSSTDLHLQAGSHCLGAGIPNGAPATTIDGWARPNPPSIGAYEASPLTTMTVGNVTGSLGQTVTLSATLKKTSGVALSGKTLTFSVDGTTVGTAVTNSSGAASLHYVVPAALAVGSHTLAAAFTGDVANAPASGTATLTVTKANTTLTLSAVSGTPGQTVTLKATLKRTTGGTALGGETVSFFVDGASVGTAVSTSVGLASLPYAISAGAAIGSSHPVSATFVGDGGNNGSTGGASLTVSKYSTTLSVSAVTGVPGQTVTLSATLKKGASGLGGQTVAFTVDGAAVGTAVTNTAGVATLPYTVPAGATIGSHPVGATFGGDASNAAATGKGTLSVKTATALSVSNVSGAHGTTVSLSATLTAGGVGLPGKTVAFKADGVTVGTAVTNANGVATLTYAIPSGDKVGSHGLGASFAGDAGDNAAVGTGTLTVS